MNEWINTYLLTIFVISIMFNIAISIYGIFLRPNYIKKIIALTIFSDSANVFAIYIGYRRWVDNINPRPPVLTTPSPEALSYFTQVAVDPLPQAL
ncbi:MAG: NADH-quinone oxidoreductase subunit K, partial [Desulfurococcaceae archaeon]